MIELPEALTLADQINSHLVGKRVLEVLPPVKPHKFCWFSLPPESYGESLKGAVIAKAEGFGIYVEITFDNGKRLCVNDGVNLRYMENDEMKKNYQLKVIFEDESSLYFSVAMYGGIYLHDGEYDNEYYVKSAESFSPLRKGFEAHFFRVLAQSKDTLSVKAFLAEQQRFPGIGNGVLQDIAFHAGISPYTRIKELDDTRRRRLAASVVETLKEMIRCGGRDTERDIFGNYGGYKTKMSKNNPTHSCPSCGTPIRKEIYLGGSVYYCPQCQPYSRA